MLCGLVFSSAGFLACGFAGLSSPVSMGDCLRTKEFYFMAKLTIRDLNVRGKRVFLRVDYNVPLEEKDGQMVITDDTRIKETLPTLKLLIEQGGKLILTAHLGRPKGQREPSMSLRPVAARLAEMLGRPVAFVDDCIGEKVEKTVGLLKEGDVLLLENVRY